MELFSISSIHFVHYLLGQTLDQENFPSLINEFFLKIYLSDFVLYLVVDSRVHKSVHVHGEGFISRESKK